MIADAKATVGTVVGAVGPLVPDSAFGMTQSSNVFTHLYNRTHTVFATLLGLPPFTAARYRVIKSRRRISLLFFQDIIVRIHNYTNCN